VTFEPMRAAYALLDARIKGHRLDRLPEESQPISEADAYAIQDAVAKTLGSVVAWKVGSATANSEPFRAPIHQHTLFVGHTSIPAEMFHVIGVEAEVVFQFERDLPPEGAPYSREAVLDAVGSMMPGIEVVDTRFKVYGASDPLAQRADQGNHGALILGAPLLTWRSLDPIVLPVRFEINGEVVCETVGGNSAVDPVRLLVWLANEGSHSLGGVRAGQVVTTGSCTGTIFVEAGASVRASFSGLGSLNLTIV
jgi:2-keto-4-pentenoate hydratase